jgi:glycosyltransferase involved in cell wall biosynthesis
MKKTKSKSKQRILTMAHAHPDFSLGGGEIAAYNLYKAFKANPDVEASWFLGRADRGRGVTGQISLRRPDEYLWEQGVASWHSMTAAHPESVTTWFADLLRALKPTVVHTHHYAHLGLEYLRVVKEVDPSIKLVMTLHEYMAICQNNGQMIKTGSFNLCSRSSPDECRACFPKHTVEDFWLRKHRFMGFFDLVDQFVSPSEFLKQRYVDWGLPADKIAVIENGQSDEPPLPPRPLAEGEKRNRFGFFGQINPFKGLDVVLRALKDMTPEERKQIVLEVHGANLENQTPEFQEKIEKLRTPLIEDGVVQWVGPYQPHELRDRMKNLDWIVIPSVWWENSPMVIQEAFSLRRPLIGSDIGGMAEKIKNNINGLHVSKGDSQDWQKKLLDAQKTSQWDKCYRGIKSPISYQNCAEAHLQRIL